VKRERSGEAPERAPESEQCPEDHHDPREAPHPEHPLRMAASDRRAARIVHPLDEAEAKPVDRRAPRERGTQEDEKAVDGDPERMHGGDIT
jgi:hypothetical protein